MLTLAETRQASAGEKAPAQAWLVVFMLCLLYIVSLIDRQIFVLLIGPLKSQFKLDDVQIGVLVGTAFASVYAFLAVPAGRIADRGNRKMLIVAGVFLWCFSTIACGFATAYSTLLILRFGLAAGEAVLTPAAHSMIGDLFPPAKRSLAVSIYTAAGLVGGPLAFSGGAQVIQGVGRALEGAGSSVELWQAVLFVIGVPGLLLGVIFAMIVREPMRSSTSPADADLSTKAIFRQLLSHKMLYAGLFIGVALAVGPSYAVNTWGVETLTRDFRWTTVQAGSAFGPILLVAGVTGALVGPWISHRLRLRGRWDSTILVCIGCTLIALIALGFGPTQSNPWFRLALLCIGVTGALGAVSTIISAIQEVAPARMRGTFIALLYMMIHLFGGGAVTVLVPWTATLGISLSEAMTVVCVILNGLALLIFLGLRATYGHEARAGFSSVQPPRPRS